MTEEMKKRLEEAAYGIYPVSEIYNDLDKEFVDTNGGLREAFQDGGEVGIELGYKKAVEQAKEWLKENSNKYASYMGISYKLIRDFEADMHKFLEEKK